MSVHKLRKLLLFLSVLTISSCQKTDLSGHWHFFSDRNPTQIIHTWDIEGDSLIIDKYNPYYDSYAYTNDIQVEDEVLTADIRWYQGVHNYIYGFVDDTLVLILDNEGVSDDVIAGKAVRRNNCSYEEDVFFHLYSEVDLLAFSEADSISPYRVLSEIFIGEPREEDKYGSNTRIQVNDVFIKPHHIDLYVEQQRDQIIYSDSIDKQNNFDNVTTHTLFVDGDTEMGFVEDVRERLTKYQQDIAYITEGTKEDSNNYQALIKKAPHFCNNTQQEVIWRKDSLAIKVDTTDFRTSVPAKQLCRYEVSLPYTPHLLIHLNGANQYLINNTQIPLSLVADKVKAYLQENHVQKVVVLEYDGKSLYKHYLGLLNEVLKAEKRWKSASSAKQDLQLLEVYSSKKGINQQK